MDRFLISPFVTGLVTADRPYLIPEDAFANIKNAYVFRGRTRKRFGELLTGSGWPNQILASYYSRVSINIGTTDGAGHIADNVPGAVFKVGQSFVVGTEIFTVTVLGNPGIMLDTGAAAVKTYSTTTGAYVITGAPINTAVYFYPAEPIMGLTEFQVGNPFALAPFAFDTQFAYTFTGGRWVRSGALLLHGTNLNFVWSDNWRGATPDFKILFITNYKATTPNPVAATDDPIWWFDGTTWTAGIGVNAFYFLPKYGGPPPIPQAAFTGPFVRTALIIIAWKGRLLLLSTIENDNPNHNGTDVPIQSTNTAYTNRVRYSQVGSPFAQNAWYEYGQQDSGALPDGGSVSAGAGFTDATTDEQIESAEFIKDRLIVYFDRSTWELAYTGNETAPFRWQKLNTELGSEATFSTVPFDKFILTMGTTGVHSCNGSNVERIDNKIPDQVFDIIDKNSGVERVAGVRDYFAEMVYWTFPATTQSTTSVYPTQILQYNYKYDTWSLNTDCITAWGYFQQQIDTTWASQTMTWADADFTWASGENQANFRQVIAGNQQGYIFIIDLDVSRNAAAMQISSMAFNAINNTLTLTVTDHTLQPGDATLDSNAIDNGDYVMIENAQGVTGVNYDSVANPNRGIYQVSAVVNANTVVLKNLLPIPFAGVYTGGGTLARVSNIIIESKQWNPYLKNGRNFYLAKIDFGVLKTQTGQVTIDYFPSSSELSMLDEGGALGTNMVVGTGILETSPYPAAFYPLEQVQQRIWHQIYFQTSGDSIQIALYMSPAQLLNPEISQSNFELDGMVLHTMPTEDRLT